jgi:O-antigen/teichoic acid export membrane protein
LVTLAAAYVLRSVWALAIGALAGASVRVILSHVWISNFSHRFFIERDAFSEIFRFGRWILLGTLFTFLGGRGLQAIQATFVSIETVGLIAIAMNIAMLPRDLSNRLVRLVGLPAFSEIQRTRPQEMKRLVLKFRLYFFALAIPVFLFLSLIAQPLVDLLYDPRYALAGSFLSLMSLNLAISALAMPYQNVMLASGDSRTHALVMFVTASFQILGVVVGYNIAGLLGMMVGGGLAGLVTYSVSVGFAARRGVATFGLDVLILLAILASYVYAVQNTSF